MERYNRPPRNEQIWEWKLILEEKGDETFTQPCPAENGSDDLFPYHHFILSNHHTHNNPRDWAWAARLSNRPGKLTILVAKNFG